MAVLATRLAVLQGGNVNCARRLIVAASIYIFVMDRLFFTSITKRYVQQTIYSADDHPLGGK
jgi:hypothetical protein